MDPKVPSPALGKVVDNIDHNSDNMTTNDVNAHSLPKKKFRHRAMSAQEQNNRIVDLEQKINVFGGPAKPLQLRQNKKRKTLTPEPEVDPTEPELKAFVNTTLPVDAHEEKATASVDYPGDEKTIDTKGDEKPKKIYRRKQNWTSSNDIPPKTVQLMKTLNNFGGQFEKVLSAALQYAKDELSRTPDTELLVKELQDMERDWKIANRESLQNVVALLSRNGVVAFGGVEVPAGLL